MTNPGIDPKPSPATAWFRWPLATAALGALIEQGDKKHRDIDDTTQGLIPIEDHYDWRYSVRKLARHLVRFAAGEDIDLEMNLPHVVCIQWHAYNMCDSWLKQEHFVLEDFMCAEEITIAQFKSAAEKASQ